MESVIFDESYIFFITRLCTICYVLTQKCNELFKICNELERFVIRFFKEKV